MPRDISFDQDAVLARARDLFWEKGYTATSIQDLENALGIRRSSIYNTFGDKRALYDLTLLRYQEENLGDLRKKLCAHDDLRDALNQLFTAAALLQNETTLTGSKGCYMVNATTEMANTCVKSLSFASENRERFTAILKEVLAGAQVQNKLDPQADPTELADYLFLCYNGLQVLVQTGIERPALVAAVRRCVDGLPWT